MPICQFSFSIKQWKIVCDKSLSEADWLKGNAHWLANRENFEDFTPKLAFLPALKRRRLSHSARLFFEAAWDLVTENPDIPVVYASANSEMERNFALWHSLLREGDVSPTSFSLSVHNALVGQWSELRQVKSETTSLMANGGNLETALLEAYLQLNEGVEQVLVIIAETPLSSMYNAVPVHRSPWGYALALVVEKGEQFTLTLNENGQGEYTPDSTLEWVRQQYLQAVDFNVKNANGSTWQWHRN